MRAHLPVSAFFSLMLIGCFGVSRRPGRLPAPGPGMQWRITFQDKFSGTSVDKMKWNGGYANLQWCRGETFPHSCAQNYDGLSELGGILSLQGVITDRRTFANLRAAMNTGGLTEGAAKFSQRYGYFEWCLKLPHDEVGEGDGLWPAVWALPIGKQAFPADPSKKNCREGNEEVDVAEAVLGVGNMHQVHFSVHDYCYNSYSIAIPRSPGPDLSQSFHRYGVLWRNDGSPEGSMQAYFDGVPQGSPYVLDSRSKLWAKGIYLLNQLIPCPDQNKPFFNGSPCTAKTSDTDPLEITSVTAYTAVPLDSARK
jgi:Glycosyl hydrolases family 16